MFMLAIQFLCYAAALLAAYMGTLGRLGSLGGRGCVTRNAVVQYWVTALGMGMGAACDCGITLLPMFVGAGTPFCSLDIAAVLIMRHMVLAQAARPYHCTAVLFVCSSGKYRLRNSRNDQRSGKQQAYRFLF